MEKLNTKDKEAENKDQSTGPKIQALASTPEKLSHLSGYLKVAGVASQYPQAYFHTGDPMRRVI